MKKLMFILSLLITVSLANAQGVKISSMPELTNTTQIGNAFFPAVYDVPPYTNYKVKGSAFALSTTTVTINGETHDLSQDRSWTVSASSVAWGDITGTLSDQTDLITALNLKVDESTTITINGVTQDLSTNRSWTITAAGGIQSIEGTNGTVVVNDSIVKLGTNPLIENTVINGASTYYLRITDSRLQEDLGASIAAANDLTLGSDGNSFSITGATQINAITTANWQAGSIVRLIFASTPTVKHNTAGGAGTAVILLSGGVDFIAAANDVLTLLYDGTSWHEVGRKLSSVAIGATRFGVTGEDATAAQNRTFAMGTNTFNWTTTKTTSGAAITFANTASTGTASTLGVTSNNGSATVSIQNSGLGSALLINGGTSATAIDANTVSGASAVKGTANPSSTNTSTVVVMEMVRATSGTAANGLGGTFRMSLEAADASTYMAGELVAKWVDATAATRTGSVTIRSVNNASNADIITFTGAGNAELQQTSKGYGLKSPDGTTHYIIVDNAGALSTTTTAP